MLILTNRNAGLRAGYLLAAIIFCQIPKRQEAGRTIAFYTSAEVCVPHTVHLITEVCVPTYRPLNCRGLCPHRPPFTNYETVSHGPCPTCRGLCPHIPPFTNYFPFHSTMYQKHNHSGDFSHCKAHRNSIFASINSAKEMHPYASLPNCKILIT